MRPSPPSSSLVSQFHQALHQGHVDVVRRLIFRTPSLANARSGVAPHATSLMVATKSGSHNLLILVNLLLNKGALLLTKDDHRRHVLMVACASGAAIKVVKCLLEWSSRGNQDVFRWSDQDADGRTALQLACVNGHGRLASFILDQLEQRDDVGGNSPLQALAAAIDSRDQRCVTDLLRNRKVKWEVERNRRVNRLPAHGEWIQLHGQEEVGAPDEEVTVSSCVKAAVTNGMVRVVQMMHRLNRRCVGQATWFTVYSALEPRSRRKGSPRLPTLHFRAEITAIANLHRRDCIWERMKLVFLVRHAPSRSVPSGRVPVNIVAELPDVLFRIVASFLKPEFDDEEEAQKERFKSVLDNSSW